MTQNTHTPGPWRKVHDHPDPETAPCVGYIRPTEKYTGYQFDIATVYGCNGAYEGDMEPEANARLIAAAPELLAALETINKYSNCSSSRETARAAIAKAKETK